MFHNRPGLKSIRKGQGEFILTRLQNNIDKLHYILDNTSHN